jgi:hypothetical protein
MVRAPVAVLARAVFEEYAPAAAVVAFDAELAEGSPRGGAEPAVIVQALRHGFLLEDRFGGEAAQLGADEPDVADPTVADDGCGAAESGLRALLGSGLDDPPRAAGDIYHGATLDDGKGHRLLAIDILAGLHRGDGHGGVPVVGGGDEHDVQV